MLTDADALLRGRVLVSSSITLGVLTLLADVVRFATVPLDLATLLVLVLVAVLLALPWVQRWTGSHRLAGGVLVVACLTSLPAFQLLQGIFPAPALLAFPIVPLIAAFFIGHRFGYVSAALLGAAAIALRLTMAPPNEVQMSTLAWTFTGLAVLVPLMCARLASAYEHARAQLERELMAARARAEAESRSKTEFLRHVSHELRTPLNAILGYGELMEEELVEAGQESLAGDLERIRGASNHLLALINDLLDISRIEAGAVDLELAEVALTPLLTQVHDTVRPLAALNRNTLVLDIPADLPPLVADERRLRQVLLNLVSNACKFTDDGTITIAALAGPEWMLLVVRDTGVGMTPEQCSRLFEPFVQVHASVEQRSKGTGLGLSLSRGLVRQFGGTLEVRSEPGRGTEFTVRLPRRAA